MWGLVESALRPALSGSRSRVRAPSAASAAMSGPAVTIAKKSNASGPNTLTDSELRLARKQAAQTYAETRSYEALHRLRSLTAECLRRGI